MASKQTSPRSAISVSPPVADQTMFRGLLGEAVEYAKPSTEADPVGVHGSLIAGCGALIGPQTYVQIGNTTHQLLVWPLLFGRTGSGRKGEATQTAEMFFFLRPMSTRTFGKAGSPLAKV